MSGGLLTPVIGKQTFRDVLGGGRDISAGNPLAVGRLSDKIGDTRLELTHISEMFDDHLRNIVVDGDYLYLSSQTDGLRIFDVSTPAVPVLIAQLESAKGIDVRKNGEYVYTAGGPYQSDQYLYVIDVSTPINPLIKAKLLLHPQDEAHGMFLLSGYLYIAVWGVNRGAFKIVDISNPLSPSIVYSSEDSDYFSGAHDVFAEGNYIYVSAQTSTYAPTAFDVTDKSAPVVVGKFTRQQTGCGIIKKGDYLFTGAPLNVYDVNDPTNIKWVGETPECEAYWICDFSDRYIAITAGKSIRILDVSNPLGFDINTGIRYACTHRPPLISSFRNAFRKGSFLYTSVLTDGGGRLLAYQIEHSMDSPSPKLSLRMFAVASLGGGGFTPLNDCLPIELQGSLNITAEETYHGSAVAGGKLHFYTSPDGMNWDTEIIETKTLAFVAGTGKRETFTPSDAVQRARYLQCKYENADTLADYLIEDCEDAWNEQVITGVTSELDTEDKKVGDGSVKLTMTADAGIGVLASEVVSLVGNTLDDYVQLILWVKSSINVAANQLQILLDDTANCASPVATINLPDLYADQWMRCLITADFSGCTALTIISVGVKQVSDLGAFTLWLDDLRATRRIRAIKVTATLGA